MVLIGLIGYKQSGKDTFADYLVSNHGFVKHAFAEPVKKICRVMFNLKDQQLNDPVLKETMDGRWGLSPRQMMQRVGTDMIRRLWDDDFWVKHMDMRLDKECDVVISDVRFSNEAQWIKDNGGILIRVDDGRWRSTDTHSSEILQSYIKEDLCVFNKKNGFQEFHLLIEETIKKILRK